MINVKFEKVANTPYSEFSVYSSLNPIPFTLKLREEPLLPETIYSRNLSGDNFIEFRFDRNTKQLYEVTLVAIQDDSIVENDSFQINDVKEGYFVCLINDNSELEISVPIEIKRYSNSLNLIWDNKLSKNFPISKNCMLGITENNCLSSVTLYDLNEKLLKEIVGF